MAKKYIKYINGIKVNLALLDNKYQNNPSAMNKYICKITKNIMSVNMNRLNPETDSQFHQHSFQHVH